MTANALGLFPVHDFKLILLQPGTCKERSIGSGDGNLACPGSEGDRWFFCAATGMSGVRIMLVTSYAAFAQCNRPIASSALKIGRSTILERARE